MADQADPGATPRRRRWPRRLAIGTGAAVAALALLSVIAGPIGRRVAEKQLTQVLGRRVSIARVRVNLFALSVTVEGLQIFEADGATPFAGFSRLYVNAELSSAVRRAPVIKEIALQSLRVHVVRERATPDAWGDVGAAYNFSDIVARLSAGPKDKPPAPPSPPDAAPPRFSLNNIHVDDAALVFDDRPTGDHHEVRELSVGIPFASTLPVYVDSFVEPGLRVRVDGTPFAIEGRTKPFKDSLETVLELRLHDFELRRYLPFVPMRLPFTLESGRLGLALDVSFARPRAADPKLTVKGTVTLDALDVRERRAGTPLVALERLAVTLGESDVTAERLHVEKVLLAGLDVRVRKERDGSLNLEHLAPEAPKPTPEARAEKKREERQERREAPARARTGQEAPALHFVVDAFDLERATVRFRDESVTPAFEADVRDVTIGVRGLSNAPGATARVQVALHGAPGGRLRDEGTLRLTPLAAAGKVTLDDLEPGRFAPYTAGLVAFDVSGRVRVGADYLFEQSGARTTVRLSDASVELADLALRRRGAARATTSSSSPRWLSAA
jgi:hypothetical protein